MSSLTINFEMKQISWYGLSRYREFTCFSYYERFLFNSVEEGPWKLYNKYEQTVFFCLTKQRNFCPRNPRCIWAFYALYIGMYVLNVCCMSPFDSYLRIVGDCVPFIWSWSLILSQLPQNHANPIADLYIIVVSCTQSAWSVSDKDLISPLRIMPGCVACH